MNQNELITRVAEKADCSPALVKAILRDLAAVTRQAVTEGESVRLPGIASVQPVLRAARVARNPHTGEPVEVESRWRVRVKPLAGLQEAAGQRPT